MPTTKINIKYISTQIQNNKKEKKIRANTARSNDSVRCLCILSMHIELYMLNNNSNNNGSSIFADISVENRVLNPIVHLLFRF